MNQLITEISKYKEFATNLFQWYLTKYKIPLQTFIQLPEIMQFNVISEFIIEKYNIAYHFDIGAYVIYYYNPELNVNEMIANSKSTGSFTPTIDKAFDLVEMNYIDSNRRAIFKVIDIINNPF